MIGENATLELLKLVFSFIACLFITFPYFHFNHHWKMAKPVCLLVIILSQLCLHIVSADLVDACGYFMAMRMAFYIMG